MYCGETIKYKQMFTINIPVLIINKAMYLDCFVLIKLTKLYNINKN